MVANHAKPRAERIAVLLPSLEGGGAERSMLNLVKGFLARGRTVDLVLCQAKGAFIDDIPAGANLVALQATNGLLARLIVVIGNARDFLALLLPVFLAKKIAPEIARIPALQRYMKERHPSVVLSALTYANLSVLWAKKMCNAPVPIVVSERNALWTYCTSESISRKWRWRYAPELVRRSYPEADAVVTVSRHAADELRNEIGLLHPDISTIYNPVVDESLRNLAQQAPTHPWFSPDAVPIVLAAGRLTEQKDFATLIQAFALVRQKREARLVILGEGRLQTNLEQLATRLGIRSDVELPGFVENPFQYMARSSVFVLSSLYEGLPGVLIQAMACGCPVVSTDCPGGSREILADGKYGALVEVGGAQSMADAILATLDEPIARDILLQRAEEFTVDRAVDNYLALLDAVVSRNAGSG